MEIKSLPQEVRDLIRSGENISNVSQCVMELVSDLQRVMALMCSSKVLNSLDAKANAVAVRINLLTLRIQVVDNGVGVTQSDMELIGLEHMTSKCNSLSDLQKAKTFGFRGQALASISKMSRKVEIVSRPKNTDDTYRKSYESGKWSEVEVVKTRPGAGTTVTITEFMHTFPVRQKRIHKNLDLDHTRRRLEELAIVHCRSSFSLRNDATGKIILQCKQCENVAQSLTSFYPDIAIGDLIQIKVSKRNISVTGLIYKTSSANGKLQFIYVNKRPVVCAELQKFINHLMSRVILKGEHPVYCLNIRCPHSSVDVTLSPSKTTVEFKNREIIRKCIEKAVKTVSNNNLPIPVEVQPSKIIEKAPSFKSHFSITQIEGAVKGNKAKRKVPFDKQSNCHVNMSNLHALLDKNSLKISNNNNDCIEVTDLNKKRTQSNYYTQSELFPSRDIENQIPNLVNQNEGKKMIMDMFLKSTVAFPAQSSQIVTDLNMFTVEKTRKKGFANTTMTMTVVSRKTILKNSKHPGKNDDMVSKCVQTTLIQEREAVDEPDSNVIRDLTLSRHFQRDKQTNPLRIAFFGSFGKRVVPIFGRSEFFFRPVPNFTKNAFDFIKDSVLCTENKQNIMHFSPRRPNPFPLCRPNFLNPFARAFSRNFCAFKRPKRNNEICSPYFKKNLRVNAFIWKTNVFSKKPFEVSPFFRQPSRVEQRHKINNLNNKPVNWYFRKFQEENPQRYEWQNNNPISFVNNQHFPMQNKFSYPTNSTNTNFQMKALRMPKNLFGCSSMNHLERQLIKVPQPRILKRNIEMTYQQPTMTTFSQMPKSNLNIIDPKNTNAVHTSPFFKKPHENIVPKKKTKTHFFNVADNQSSNCNSNFPKYRNQQLQLELTKQNSADKFFPETKNVSKDNSQRHEKTNSLNSSISVQFLSGITNKLTDRSSFPMKDDFPKCSKQPVQFFESKKVPLFADANEKTCQNSVIINSDVMNQPFQIPKTTFSVPNNYSRSLFPDTYLGTEPSQFNSKMPSFFTSNTQNKPLFSNDSTTTSVKKNVLALKKHKSDPLVRKTKLSLRKHTSDPFPKTFQTENFACDPFDFSQTVTYNEFKPDLCSTMIEENNSCDEILSEKKSTCPNLRVSVRDQLCEQKNDVCDNNKITEWIQKKDKYGNTFYLNCRTGMTSAMSPKESHTFSITKRMNFVPKGLSPIFVEDKKINVSLSPNSKKALHYALMESYKNELNTIKWSRFIDNNTDIEEFFKQLYSEKTKQFEQCLPNVAINVLPRSMIKLCNNIQAQSYSKVFLTNLEILGQWDKKFIVTYSKSHQTLFVFDQHAVSERIRVEKLLKDYKEEDAFKASRNDLLITNTFSEADLRILTEFGTVFKNIGIYYSICGQTLKISHIPDCIFVKHSNDSDHLKKLVVSVISEQVQMIQATRGVGSKVPQILQNVINSEACRGAIKFGDYISNAECEDLIQELYNCQLPFQCAHGRPSFVPVVNLERSFIVEKCKPNLGKLRN